MRNIILFGGAFDPIHIGHLLMADTASKELDADVFFIPAKISVWKKTSAPFKDKVELIKLAIKDFNNSRFYVSEYEGTLSSDTNYTINTVRHFKEEYKDAKFYLLIGQDQVNSFHLWKEALELSKLAQIVFFRRVGDELNEENVKTYDMKEILGEPNNISSTEIRELHSLDITDSEIKYIMDHDLYFMGKIKSMMGEKRYNHTKSVAKLSYEIALSNKIKEPKKALIAALVHDCAKELKVEDQREIMVVYFKEYLSLHPIIYHQFIGAMVTKETFGIEDQEILDAVKYHTTGNENMGDIAKIVYAADKIEPTRGFDSTELINAMKSSITEGFITVLKANVEFFNQKKIDYQNPLTEKCLKQYLG